MTSSCNPILRGLPQSSALDPSLFLLHINDVSGQLYLLDIYPRSLGLGLGLVGVRVTVRVGVGVSGGYITGCMVLGVSVPGGGGGGW